MMGLGIGLVSLLFQSLSRDDERSDWAAPATGIAAPVCSNPSVGMMSVLTHEGVGYTRPA